MLSTDCRHSLTEDPTQADIVLFVENWTCDFLLSSVAADPIAKTYPKKVFCFCENDNVLARFPGVYASLPKRFCDPRWANTGPYLWMMRKSEVPVPSDQKPDLLFSFMGSVYTHPIRKELMKIMHARAHIEDIGRKTEYMRYHAPEAEKASFRKHYDSMINRSKFVLCPRGMACASIRFFETLRAGRVPVLISDDYLPPPGPDWNSCVVKVAQHEVAFIPERLEAIESRAEEMGRAAAGVFRDWYAPSQFFSRVVDQCAAIQVAGIRGQLRATLSTANQLRQTPYVANVQRQLRSGLRKLILGSTHA